MQANNQHAAATDDAERQQQGAPQKDSEKAPPIKPEELTVSDSNNVGAAGGYRR